jgi:hypothetical protein
MVPGFLGITRQVAAGARDRPGLECGQLCPQVPAGVRPKIGHIGLTPPAPPGDCGSSGWVFWQWHSVCRRRRVYRTTIIGIPAAAEKLDTDRHKCIIRLVPESGTEMESLWLTLNMPQSYGSGSGSS